MDQFDQHAAVVTLWGSGATDCEAHGMPLCIDCYGDTMYYRLTGGYELLVSAHGASIGELRIGTWNVRAFHFGQPLHTIPGLITLSPSSHLDAARSAVVTLKCAGLISADSVEA